MSALSRQHIEQLVTGSHWDPLAILGPHMSQQNGVPALVIRSFLQAREAVVLAQTSDEVAFPTWLIHESGLFEAVLPPAPAPSHYRLRVVDHAGPALKRADPYALRPLLSDFDLHLFAEGTFFKAYETLRVARAQD